MDCTDDTARSNDLLHEIDMYRYERYNSTYHEVNSGRTNRNRGELSTQSIQGLLDIGIGVFDSFEI